MKFNVNVVRNTEHVTWVYDTDNNHIYNERGELMNEKVIQNGYDLGGRFTQESNPNVKTLDNLRLFEILLGFNCNFNCEYCGQLSYRDKVPSSSPADVPAFIEMIKELGIKDPNRVSFWGGEPLVYWKTLEVLIPELRKIWHDSFCTIITNGSLLTKDKIDFFKKYGIALTVSYDCCEETARGTNIGRDPKIVECLKYANEQLGDFFAIWVTVTPGNTNFERIESHLKELIGNVRIVYYPLKCATQNGVYSHEEQQQIEEKLFNIINSNDPQFNFGAVDYHAQMLIHRIMSHSPMERATSHCQFPYSHGVLASLDGTVWNCHIRPQKIGHLKDIPNGKVTAIGLNDWTNYDYCYKCPWIHNCGGTCHTLPKDRHLLVCQNFRPWYEGIFKGVFARLFGVYVESVEYDLPESKTIPITQINSD